MSEIFVVAEKAPVNKKKFVKLCKNLDVQNFKCGFIAHISALKSWLTDNYRCCLHSIICYWFHILNVSVFRDHRKIFRYLNNMHFDKYGKKRINSKVHILYINTTITKEHAKILDGIVSIKSFLLIFFYTFNYLKNKTNYKMWTTPIITSESWF